MDNILKERLSIENLKKLEKINNEELHNFISKYIMLCNPENIFVCDSSEKDIQYIKNNAIEDGEEIQLKTKGQIIHFDNYNDQGRDKKNTGILIPKDYKLEALIETKDRNFGLEDIHNTLKNIMKGHTLYVLFFCLGPENSNFSIPCVQLTDSSYVAHNEFLLYRSGYSEFLKIENNSKFFKFVHSEGELTEKKVSKNLDKRRIYIDIFSNTVFSTNTQYGGNTIGLKKLAMRLAIFKASQEGWLTEHMLIMGINGPKNRKTYFAGAFPSMCGKTSTAMMEGESIVGDDIAYLKINNDEARAVNVEKGMFGIIQGINSKDDPFIWEAINSENEIIFSNVLLKEDKTLHWIGKDGEVPEKGINHSGDWYKGKKDSNGKETPCSHPNARFTLSLETLKNVDENLHNKNGVKIDAIVYGGRDSDTNMPVEEAFDWVHGIITKGAALESETTAATLGMEGVREFNPGSNLDFLSIPVGRYINDNINFGLKIKNPPVIFGVNYFIKDREGNFLNRRMDKRVWYKLMELRVHNEVDVIITPTGKIPFYEDLRKLFMNVLKREYTKNEYDLQFMIRVPENLKKINKIIKIYKERIFETPEILFKVLEEQKIRLLKTKDDFGDYILPEKYI